MPESMHKPLIEMRNISREINGSNNKIKTLLSNVSWSLHQDSRVAVLSKSQPSAQAFLQCASGVTQAQTGSVTINGNISWPIGMRGGLSPAMSGRHNAYFLQQIYGEAGQEKRDLEFIQSLAGINDELFRKPIKRYSKVIGERFYIALALAFEFDAYIIPKSYIWKSEALNERQADFYQALKERTEGKPLVMAGSDHNFLREFCNEGILIENGEIAFSGEINDCLSRFNESTDSEQLQEEELEEDVMISDPKSVDEDYKDSASSDNIW